MRQSVPFDVILLNSDTEVTPNWLDKLQMATYSRPEIGTATPLTNRGTICSVPEFLADNDLPPGYSLHEFAAMVESVSLRKYPKLPTCVGFCVYIKREVIDRIGVFDEESFGKGYGEENDFSCRLQAAGYVDILDDATFVYHHGSTSFQSQASTLAAEHLKILSRKHPKYLWQVDQFIASGSLRDIHHRIHRAMLRRWCEKSRYSILHILHLRPNTRIRDHRPGGIEYHVADLVRNIPEAMHWSLYPSCGRYNLIAHTPGGDCEYETPFRVLDLPGLLKSDLFNIIHLHHTDGMDKWVLADALRDHGHYFVSLHDFALCCPRINLLTPELHLCKGRECSNTCHQTPEAMHSLRGAGNRLLQNAKAVFHFSQSTRERFADILGENHSWRFVEHGIEMPSSHLAAGANDLPKPSVERPLKVAFLGGIGLNKGARLVEQVTKIKTLPSGVPIEWHLIGLIDGEVDSSVQQHGCYRRGELPSIMEQVSPDVAAIVSLWPETYCYTFDEALACRVPVICTPLGAPAERLERLQCGWKIDSLTPEGIVKTLQGIVDDWDQYNATRRHLASIPSNDVARITRQYFDIYTKGCRPLENTGEERLAVIETLFSGKMNRLRASARRCVGHVLNNTISLIETLRLRMVVAGVARRVLPVPMRRKIVEMRQHIFWS
jgi:GT2 family glycosyltransferase